MNTLKNKRILITGGTGSIGSTLVKEILINHKPKQIRIFSRDDTKQFDLMQELPKDAPVNFLIGDIRDKARLMRAMENIDIVFHAAAMKHVTLCERNPFEAFHTNVLGTQNVIDCALECNVDKVVYISTDKAVDPLNIMGTTKLLAEKLILTSYFYKGNKNKTKFCCVRFGNVLWSRGSVLPLFIRQIKSGKFITLTNPKMTRFFMSMSEAAKLVINALEMTKESEIFVLKMPSVSMGDVVKALQEIMIEEKIVNKVVPVKIIGNKEGERIHEKLLTLEESENALEMENHFIIRPNFGVIPKKFPLIKYPKTKKAKIGEYNTKTSKLLLIDELKILLKEGDFYKTFL